MIVNELYHKNQLPMRFYMSMDLRLNPNIDMFLNRVGNLVDYSLGDMVTIVGGHVGPLDEGPNVPDNILTDQARHVIPELPALAGDTEGHGENQWAQTTWTHKQWEDLTLNERMMTEWGTVMESRKLGWNLVGMHNMGSRAGRIFMETFTQAENQPGILAPRYRPLALDHNLNWSPESIAMAAKMKDSVRFGLQDTIFQQREVKGKRNEVIAAQWGDLMHTMQPVKELLDKGVRFHLEGGDPWKRAPMKRIQEYVTRKDDQGRSWGPRQGIDRKTALLASSRWAARFIDEDKTLGSIEPGKRADLVVFDGDFLTIPEDKIGTLKVELTMVNGKAVYEK
jgi:predicted amidohydrolase YtcJ